MARSVRVEMILDTVRAVAGARRLSQATGDAAKSLGDTAREGDKAGRAIDAAGEEMSEAARAAAALDREVERLTGSLREMAIAQALSGGDYARQIREQETAIRRLTRNRKLFADSGEEGAVAFATKFSARLGPLLAHTPLSGPLVAAVGAAGVVAAPVLTGVLSAAISAGVGGGALAAGLALAAKDPVVAQRGKEVGTNFVAALQARASQAFQGPLLTSLDRLEVAGARMTERFGRAFDAVAPHVVPLLDKLIAGADKIGGALERAARQSGPALDALGDSIGLLADGAADFIDILSKGGPEAASNLRLVAGATADVARHTANFLSIINQLGNNPWITGPLLPLLRKHYDDAASSGRKMGSGTFGVAQAMDTAARAARGELSAMTALSAELRAQADPVFALRKAEDDLKTAQDRATEAIRKHGRNSVQAREATRNLALAAIDLQNRAGALGGTFTGRLTPQMYATMRAAGLTERQINDVEREFREAKVSGDRFAKRYGAAVTVSGAEAAMIKLRALNIMQNALRKGTSISVSAARALAGDAKAARQRGVFGDGGYTGPGSKWQPAGVVHADEYVIRKESREKIERRSPGLLDQMNATGRIPGYATGGLVRWPYPTTAGMTRIPSRKEVERVIVPAVPTGGRTDQWMIRIIRQAFPGLNLLSAYRPGSRTLSGNRSYHSMGRATDWSPSIALARWINAHYFGRTRELISPWNSLNIHNGRRHTYTGAVYRQHNFAGGNAHVHWAMARGGIVREPVFGYGLRSGNSYSLAERGPERVTPLSGGGGAVTLNLTFAGPVGSQQQLQDWLVASLQKIQNRARGV